MMRTIVRLAVAGLVIISAAAAAEAQTRRTTGAQQQRQPPVQTGNSYGLPDCAQRPFARDCDRRGTW